MLAKKLFLAVAFLMTMPTVAQAQQSVKNADILLDYDVQISIKSDSILVAEFSRPKQYFDDRGKSSIGFKTEADMDAFLAVRPDYTLLTFLDFVSIPVTKKVTIATVGTFEEAEQMLDRIRAKNGNDSDIRLSILPVNRIQFNGFR